MNENMNEEIEYARLSIKRIISFSINYVLENNSGIFDNLNIMEFKQTLYFFIEPIVMFYKNKTNNYTIQQDKIKFLSDYESFKPLCYELKNIFSINFVSIYILGKVLWFFGLISSGNANISKEEQKLITFISLISIILEIYFYNNKQITNIKDLMEIIKNKIKITDIKELTVKKNDKIRFLDSLINRFEIDKREMEIKQLKTLNIKQLINKGNRKALITKTKNTISKLLATSAITFAVIKAVVRIVSLVTNKTIMLPYKNLNVVNNKAFNMKKSGIIKLECPDNKIMITSGINSKSNNLTKIKNSKKSIIPNIVNMINETDKIIKNFNKMPIPLRKISKFNEKSKREVNNYDCVEKLERNYGCVKNDKLRKSEKVEDDPKVPSGVPDFGNRWGSFVGGKQDDEWIYRKRVANNKGHQGRT